MHSDQQRGSRQRLRNELELLRRLGIARRCASTRLPIIQRTGLRRLVIHSDLTAARVIEKAPALAEGLTDEQLAVYLEEANSRIMEHAAKGDPEAIEQARKLGLPPTPRPS